MTGNNFRAPCASIEDAESLKNGVGTPRSTVIGPHASSVLMEESYAPVKAAAPSPAPVIGWNPQETTQALKASPPQSPKLRRPELSKEHWQMSPADCTQGLGMDLYGTDVATMMDAGWQVMLWSNEPTEIGCKPSSLS